MSIADWIGRALDDRRTKPRSGMRVAYFPDGAVTIRATSATIVRAIDRNTVELELKDGSRVTATWATGKGRPPRSWDFLV